MWVHLDVAGPVLVGRGTQGAATGFGVKNLEKFVEKVSAEVN